MIAHAEQTRMRAPSGAFAIAFRTGNEGRGVLSRPCAARS